MMIQPLVKMHRVHRSRPPETLVPLQEEQPSAPRVQQRHHAHNARLLHAEDAVRRQQVLVRLLPLRRRHAAHPRRLCHRGDRPEHAVRKGVPSTATPTLQRVRVVGPTREPRNRPPLCVHHQGSVRRPPSSSSLARQRSERSRNRTQRGRVEVAGQRGRGCRRRLAEGPQGRRGRPRLRRRREGSGDLLLAEVCEAVCLVSVAGAAVHDLQRTCRPVLHDAPEVLEARRAERRGLLERRQRLARLLGLDGAHPHCCRCRRRLRTLSSAAQHLCELRQHAGCLTGCGGGSRGLRRRRGGSGGSGSGSSRRRSRRRSLHCTNNKPPTPARPAPAHLHHPTSHLPMKYRYCS
eukprot:Rhum_TRINITY_DN3679_c0_g1::Rhum_TRINITY_DN3679_c0_g1_i1::g.11665::m.11665